MQLHCHSEPSSFVSYLFGRCGLLVSAPGMSSFTRPKKSCSMPSASPQKSLRLPQSSPLLGTALKSTHLLQLENRVICLSSVPCPPPASRLLGSTCSICISDLSTSLPSLPPAWTHCPIPPERLIPSHWSLIPNLPHGRVMDPTANSLSSPHGLFSEIQTPAGPFCLS